MLLEYVFYKFYRSSQIFDSDDIPEWKAVLFLSLIHLLNFIVVFVETPLRKILRELTEVTYFEEKVKIVVIYGILVFFNYHLFVKDKKYITIEKKFKNESKKNKIIGTIFVTSYVIFSNVIIFLTAKK